MSPDKPDKPVDPRLPITYETKLNDFLPGSGCRGICQHDLRRFGAELLLKIHPTVAVDRGKQ